jgi:hypothetical protein
LTPSITDGPEFLALLRAGDTRRWYHVSPKTALESTLRITTGMCGAGYFHNGLPHDQTLWIDELAVGTKRLPLVEPKVNSPSL